MPEYVTKEAVKQAMRSQPKGVLFTAWELDRVPTVDAVEVDEIRVDIMRLCLENQEAVLNVFICGKPNEVKLPFSKEVVEVVHGRWLPDMEEFDDDPAVGIRGGVFQTGWKCSICGRSEPVKEPYCNCGAKMDGGINK